MCLEGRSPQCLGILFDFTFTYVYIDFLTPALPGETESFFLFPPLLVPQIIVMYLQVLECERNQTLVQTAW